MRTIRSMAEFDALPVGSRLQFSYGVTDDIALFEKQEDGEWLTTRDDLIADAVGHKGGWSNVGGMDTLDAGSLSVFEEADHEVAA